MCTPQSSQRTVSFDKLALAKAYAIYCIILSVVGQNAGAPLYAPTAPKEGSTTLLNIHRLLQSNLAQLHRDANISGGQEGVGAEELRKTTRS